MPFGEADTRAKLIDPARRNDGSSRHEAMRYDADVKFYTFEIVIEKEEEDEGYLAHSPTLPGCFSNGKTTEVARSSSTLHHCSLMASPYRSTRSSSTSRS